LRGIELPWVNSKNSHNLEGVESEPEFDDRYVGGLIQHLQC
jgi:hypothetical protein